MRTWNLIGTVKKGEEFWRVNATDHITVTGIKDVTIINEETLDYREWSDKEINEGFLEKDHSLSYYIANILRQDAHASVKLWQIVIYYDGRITLGFSHRNNKPILKATVNTDRDIHFIVTAYGLSGEIEGKYAISRLGRVINVIEYDGSEYLKESRRAVLDLDAELTTFTFID